MNKDIRFSKSATIFSSKESLWSVLLSGQLYENAWSAQLETTWEAGTDIRFYGIWEGVKYFDKGVILVNDKYKTIQFSYWSSFWDVNDLPEEYCFITFKIDALDDMTCECSITQDGFRDKIHYAETKLLLTKTLDTLKLEAEKISLASLANKVFDKLILVIGSMAPGYYNNSFRDSWTPGQIAEHIISSSSGLTQFFGDATTPSGRYDQNVPSIRAMLLDTTHKLKAPDALVPPIKMYDGRHQMEQLRVIKNELEHCIKTLDFAGKCESYPMPPFGLMSVFEWLTFTVYHIARHTSHLELLMKKHSAYQI